MTDDAADGARTARVGLTVALVGVCAAFLACYSDVVRLLVWQWWSNNIYSYAFLIPGITGFLVWTKRLEVMAVMGPPSYRTGVPTMVLGLAMLLAGRVGSFGVLQELSILVTLAGGILTVGGLRVARIVWLPVAYLLFTIPIWDIFTERLHFPFQLLTARMGESLLGVLGVPAYRIGTMLQLPSVTLEVAKECSGVNYLISIVVIAIPYAYMSLSGAVRRVALVVIAVGVAILSNGLRVAFIGGLQYYGLSNQADLHGPAHVLQGMFVAVVGYVALFVAARLLEQRPRHKAAAVGGGPRIGHSLAIRPLTRPLLIVAALLFGAAVLRPLSEIPPVPLAGRETLPVAVGDWSSTVGQVERTPIRATRADQEFCREYYRDGVGTIHLYVGYFAAQRQGRKLVGFGGASLPASARRLSLSTRTGIDVEVAEADVATPGGKHRYLITWYSINGGVTPSEYWVKALTVWNSVVHRRSNGAVVALTIDDAPGVDAERGRSALRQFAADILQATQLLLVTGT